MCSAAPPWLAILPALLTWLLTVLGGIALGAWAGSLTRPLLQQLNLPSAVGVGLGIGLGAALHTIILMVGTFFFNWGQLPIGLLAAGVLFGTLVALVTLSWEGAGLVAGFLGSYVFLTGAATLLLFNFLQVLRYLPPFLQEALLAVFAVLGGIVATMVQIAILTLVATAAALTARLVRQFLESQTNSSGA